MEGEKRLKRQVKKHKWFRLCDVIVFSRASSDSVTREIIRIITATHSAERVRAKSKACLAQQRREPLWCSCIDIKKKPDKGVQCQTFTRTGSGPPNLPIKVHSKYRIQNTWAKETMRSLSGRRYQRPQACLHRHTLKYWQQTENNYRTGECSGHTQVRVPVNPGAWSQPPFNGNVFPNINKTTNCSLWNIQDVYDVSVCATEFNVYSWEPVVTPQRRLWLARRCYSPSPQA